MRPGYSPHFQRSVENAKYDLLQKKTRVVQSIWPLKRMNNNFLLNKNKIKISKHNSLTNIKLSIFKTQETRF